MKNKIINNLPYGILLNDKNVYTFRIMPRNFSKHCVIMIREKTYSEQAQKYMNSIDFLDPKHFEQFTSDLLKLL